MIAGMVTTSPTRRIPLPTAVCTFFSNGGVAAADLRPRWALNATKNDGHDGPRSRDADFEDE